MVEPEAPPYEALRLITLNMNNSKRKKILIFTFFIFIFFIAPIFIAKETSWVAYPLFKWTSVEFSNMSPYITIKKMAVDDQINGNDLNSLRDLENHHPILFPLKKTAQGFYVNDHGHLISLGIASGVKILIVSAMTSAQCVSFVQGYILEKEIELSGQLPSSNKIKTPSREEMDPYFSLRWDSKRRWFKDIQLYSMPEKYLITQYDDLLEIVTNEERLIKGCESSSQLQIKLVGL